MTQATLIYPRWLISMDETQPKVQTDRAVLIRGKKIEAILAQQEARSLSGSHIDLPDHALMPGLINLHAHSAMTLLRGLADDLALMDWLNKHIWPAEGRHVSDAFVYDGTLVAMAEMLLGGTTTVNDMYFFHGAVAKAALRMGMRTYVGCSILEFPTPYAADAADYLRKALNTRVAFYGEDLVNFVLAPHAPYTVSDATFRAVAEAAEREEMLIHCHLHETADEISGSLKEHGCRPLARLDKLGVLSPRWIGAHMVHADADDIAIAARHRLSVAHNPASNMKLASGFAPVQAMLDAGIAVGLGTDGAASNNSLDMFADARLAALIAKGHSGDPTALDAYTTLKMATVHGAAALHRSDDLGSLTPGKRADMIAVNLSHIGTQPVFDPISHLAYAAHRDQVSHVWVNGECLVHEGRLTRADLGELSAKASEWGRKIRT